MYAHLYTFGIMNIYPGKIYRNKLKELERSQWLSRQELEDIQLRKLRQLVIYAYDNVPYYRERYRREGIHPEDIKSLDDFQNIPFLSRDDVMDNQKELVSTVYREPVVAGQTSGSTGTPMHFIIDKKSQLLTNAYNARCRGWYGVKPGDKRALVTAIPIKASDRALKKRLSDKIKRHRYLNVRTLNDTTMQAFAEMLLKWQPDMFRAYPTSLTMFANFLKDRNITGITPKLLEVTAEKVTPVQRQLLEEVFHAPVADHYASLEIYSYAYQCSEGGLHVNEDRYLELVENDSVVSPGRMGEVVVTALDQYAMPFIRYKNGDIAMYEAEDCPCGRKIPVLREVVGRNCDWLVHSDGSVVHWALVTAAMKPWTKVRQYQVYQPDRKNLELRLELKEKIDDTYLERIRNEFIPLFGESIKITVRLLERIELTSGGKHRYVISEVTPDGM
jgi:phenylacetate-CoA ligase